MDYTKKWFVFKFAIKNQSIFNMNVNEFPIQACKCMAKEKEEKKNMKRKMTEQCEIRTTLLQMTSWTEKKYDFTSYGAWSDVHTHWMINTVTTSSAEINIVCVSMCGALVR